MTTHRWVIPDGFIPQSRTGGHDGHESVCVLNGGDEDATLVATAYFDDREPVTGRGVVVGARRARHLRTSRPEDIGLELPSGVPYALVVTSDRPLDLQYSRLDTTQPAYTLMTTALARTDGAA